MNIGDMNKFIFNLVESDDIRSNRSIRIPSIMFKDVDLVESDTLK